MLRTRTEQIPHADRNGREAPDIGEYRILHVENVAGLQVTDEIESLSFKFNALPRGKLDPAHAGIAFAWIEREFGLKAFGRQRVPFRREHYPIRRSSTADTQSR